MEANHNNSMTLQAHNKNGKTRFKKKKRLWSTSLKQALRKRHYSHRPIQPAFEGDEDDGIWMVWNQ
jgi:hypothetical protein